MLDDLKHYAKYTGMWLSTRGVVTLAVLGATMGLGLGASTVPLLSLPLGLAAAVYMNNDRSSYLKTRVKNAYKLELAATLHKDPREVTVADFERVAKGDTLAGLPGNGVLKEQLDQINADRRVSLFANIGAVGLAVATFGALMLGGFSNVIEGWQNFMEPLSSRLPVLQPDVFAVGALASGITLSSDYVLSRIGERTAGLTRQTAYDLIQEMKKDRGNGHPITPEQVLEIFVLRDPSLAASVKREYGNAYFELPREEQALVLGGLEQKDLIATLTQKINEGRVSLNELAFLAEGQHSGLPEREPVARRVPLFLPNILASKEAAKVAAPSPAPEPAPATTEATPPADAPEKSYVERYVTHVNTGKESKSFVERLAQEHEKFSALGLER